VKRTLVTGAGGFVGRALCRHLHESGEEVWAAVRRPGSAPADAVRREVVVGEIGPDTDWAEALDGVGAVAHLAARVHVMKETAPDPLAAFRTVNLLGTERLAAAAAERGVERLLFLSTIGVNGDETDQPPGAAGFTEDDPPRPRNLYSRSKWEAEEMLHRRAGEAGPEVVIVRAPLVYGPGAPGNFLELLRWTERGLPLPLGNTRNRRSLVYVENLADFLAACLRHPRAAGETFVISDPETPSTSELIRRIAREMGRPARLFPFPEGPLRFLARRAGRGKTADRLFGSLVVDASKARERLGWRPPVGMEEGLAKTVAWYREAGANAPKGGA
jgi:nucleoside-diphosphate-sugar epimerase